jgi:hypothetical protein
MPFNIIPLTSLEDIEKKFINEEVWPMLDNMRYMLIRFVSESIIEMYPGLESITDEDFIGKFFRMGLNHMCSKNLNKTWHSYGKGTDEYIVTTLNKLLAYKFIKGLICLIKFIRVMETRVIQYINVDDISKGAKSMNFREFGAHTKKLVTKGVDEVIISFKRSNTPIKCPTNGLCTGYDGGDCYLTGMGFRIDI